MGGVIGLTGTGGAYVFRSLGGDAGTYTAPSSHPVITTRGTLDEPEGPTRERRGSWTFDDATELFVFVHGLNTAADAARNQAYTVEVGLSTLRPTPVICYSWDSDIDWQTAKRNATANGEVLAQWLTEWHKTDGRPVHLLGYSLGAQVTCEALRVLLAIDHSDVVASVSLLGGAIPDSSVTHEGRYGDAIAATPAPVSNFYSRNDRVLGWIYRIGDRNRAVGYNGISDTSAAPAGYHDIDVTDIVEDHHSYFQPEAGCLPRVVEQLE